MKFTNELELREWTKAHSDPGISEAARAALAAEADTTGWGTFNLPANHPRFAEISGEAVWRRQIEVPANWAGQIAILHIPSVKSFDTVTLNGVTIGSTSKDTDPKNPNPWNVPRAYRIPLGVLKAGINTLAIRQFCPDQEGGIKGQPDHFHLQLLIPDNQRLQPYVPNLNEDFKYGDDPYRYYRW